MIVKTPWAIPMKISMRSGSRTRKNMTISSQAEISTVRTILPRTPIMLVVFIKGQMRAALPCR